MSYLAILEWSGPHTISHPTLWLGLLISPNMKVVSEASGGRGYACVPWTKWCSFLVFHNGYSCSSTPYVKRTFYFHVL